MAWSEENADDVLSKKNLRPFSEAARIQTEEK